ncbi:MAG: DNA translocase FtsK, partial [Oscillospiraceae bacterium]|nr:DNA translocase FtsK [Oscillospiraceae bacterium]
STQRPTADVVTGLIKANIPSRIALYVKEQISSRIILDTGGAEKLLGNGDMLYLPNGQLKPIRVQGCYVSTQEIERVVSFVKKESVSEYDESIIQAVEQIAASKTDENAGGGEPESQLDGDAELIEKAIEVVVYAGQASTSNLQRRLKLGYARAARIMDELEEMGIIGPYEGAKPRRVLLSKMQYEERRQKKLGGPEQDAPQQPEEEDAPSADVPADDAPPFDMN